MTHSPVLEFSDQLPIKTVQPVHSGKVRSVYWLTQADSQRIINQRHYNIPLESELGIMIISDRISAFDCVWKAENNMHGVPGKGAALNLISKYWFDLFKQHNLANSHILEMPHPLVWIVQKAKPLMIEAIGRQYITGSMWRSYEKGERCFCGIQLPNHLEKNQKLPELLITPSTKGIIKGIAGVEELDDTNITQEIIKNNLKTFAFQQLKDVALYETLLKDGFNLIASQLQKLGLIFVDTKFEFGYINNIKGEQELIYIDEVGTPDSSRIWEENDYKKGKVKEYSKELFRELLMNYVEDKQILLDGNKMSERKKLAQTTRLPQSIMLEVSKTYAEMVQAITGEALIVPVNPEAEIIEILNKDYQLIQ